MTEAQLAAWRTRNIGFIFQFYHLLPVLTAYENVELPLLLLPLSAGQAARSRCSTRSTWSACRIACTIGRASFPAASSSASASPAPSSPTRR